MMTRASNRTLGTFGILGFSFAWIALIAHAWAQDPMGNGEGLDSASTQALQQTQELLADPTKRNAAIRENANAQLADSHLKGLAGTDGNTEKLYGISSGVFEELAKKSGGDPIKMQQMMIEAKKNPEEFFKSLSPENRAAIENAARGISSAPTTAPQGGQSMPSSSGPSQ